MASTERLSPLAAWAARFNDASATPASFSIRELPYAAQINLRGAVADPGFSSGLRAVLGYDVPATSNTWAGDADNCTLWLGPDEWLVVAQGSSVENDASMLREALAGTHHSIVELSATRTIIELSGVDARVVLAKGCPLDLASSVFKPGGCAQSLLAKSQVILQCVDAVPTLRIFVRNSFAAYVAEWLLDAAAELAASRNAGMVGLRL
jgi:sarcosine oxidase, subunit gamma